MTDPSLGFISELHDRHDITGDVILGSLIKVGSAISPPQLLTSGTFHFLLSKVLCGVIFLPSEEGPRTFLVV